MTTRLTKLEAARVLYYSPGDEDAFFRWLNNIRCVESIDGQGHTLNIWIDREKLDDDGLRELCALFYRYSVDMSQLDQFETKANSVWFRRSETYWYPLVFGDQD